MRMVCQRRILMKYHALFVIFEKAAKFEIVVCCKLYVALYTISTSWAFPWMCTIFIMQVRNKRYAYVVYGIIELWHVISNNVAFWQA